MIVQLTIVFPETSKVSEEDYEALYAYDPEENWWNR